MGSIAQCKDDNRWFLRVRNAGFARLVVNGFLGAITSLSLAHGMASELSAESVMEPVTSKRATRLRRANSAAILCRERERLNRKNIAPVIVRPSEDGVGLLSAKLVTNSISLSDAEYWCGHQSARDAARKRSYKRITPTIRNPSLSNGYAQPAMGRYLANIPWVWALTFEPVGQSE